MTYEEYTNMTFIEYYYWYDSPLYYLLKDEREEDVYYVLYLYEEDTNNQDVLFFIVKVNYDEVLRMKTSNLLEWYSNLLKLNRLYFIIFKNTNNDLEFRFVNESDLKDGIPSIHFTEY